MQTLHFLYCIYELNYTFLYDIICLVKKIMAKIGLFFYINNKLIYNACDLDEIAEAFEIGEYVTASDFHYHCKNCSDALFDDMDW